MGFGYFLMPCLCNEARTAYSWSIGVPVLHLIQMLANQGEQAYILKVFHILYLYSLQEISHGERKAGLGLTISFSFFFFFFFFILAFVMYMAKILRGDNSFFKEEILPL